MRCCKIQQGFILFNWQGVSGKGVKLVSTAIHICAFARAMVRINYR
ncbi:hypothetical protein PLUTE_a5045 [Pseudoalteromonas luteoviolacea DSM 6061]|nr:hypothetical protein [Pseudoalteromonas luteoviolacea DSM 6061]